MPAESIFGPNYETGRAVRWQIGQVGAVPLGIAGIWSHWRSPDRLELYSFALLTVNADDHPLIRRFHKPDDEKRMVAILDPAENDACGSADRALRRHTSGSGWASCSPMRSAGAAAGRPR